MEKSQLNLCNRVLRELYKAGVLDGVIVIGSWALYFDSLQNGFETTTATILASPMMTRK